MEAEQTLHHFLRQLSSLTLIILERIQQSVPSLHEQKTKNTRGSSKILLCNKVLESDEIQSKRARNVTKELYINGIQESKNLGLSDEDKENIFDILENVSPFAD